MKGLEGKLNDEQLRSLGLFSLGETEGTPQCSYNFLVRGRVRADTDIFSGEQRQNLREWHEAASGSFRLDIRKRFFLQRVFEHCSRLLREVVTAPRLTEFKKLSANASGT